MGSRTVMCESQVSLPSFISWWKSVQIPIFQRGLSWTLSLKTNPDDCLISICTPDSSLNFTDSMLVYTTCIPWTPLDIDLTVDTTPKCWQATSLRHNIRTVTISLCMYFDTILLTQFLATICLPFSYIRQLGQRRRNTPSLITKSLDLAALFLVL
jgi:hypothetical protein